MNVRAGRPPQVAAGENPLSGATDISQGREHAGGVAQERGVGTRPLPTRTIFTRCDLHGHESRALIRMGYRGVAYASVVVCTYKSRAAKHPCGREYVVFEYPWSCA